MSTLTELAAVLAKAGYERESLGRIGAILPRGRAVDPEALERATAEPTDANTLVRLFYLGRRLERARLERVLAPIGVGPLVEAGLLMEEEGGGVRAECVVIPVDDFVVLRDFDTWATGKPLANDYVLGVGLSTKMLADFTVRRGGEKVLDLGTGQGYHAMLASRHAVKVIGTDINARALRLARMGMELSGVTGVELREGSMFEPVAGEEGTFDLIVSNPPFVISPPHDISALGGRWEGDRFVQELIETAPRFLKEGGYAAVMCNWHHPTMGAWKERPLGWIEGRGVDAWVVKLKTDDARTYAESWLRESASVVSDAAMLEAPKQVGKWMEYYNRIGVGAVSLGVIFLHKRSGGVGNFVREEAIDFDARSGSSSAQVVRLFANERRLREVGAETDLLELKLRVSPDAELNQKLKAGAGTWELKAALLRESKGFEFSVGLEGVPSTILARLDGTRTAREVVSGLAKELGADPAVAMRQTAPFLAKMLRMTHVEVV